MSGIKLLNGVVNQFGAPSINENTLANRPTAGQVGRLFVDTTNNILYRDNGTSWDQIGSTSTTPNLQAVCTAGNTYTGDVYFNSIRVGHGSNGVSSNTLVGQNALNSTGGAANNTVMGFGAMAAVVSSSDNTAIGYNAGANLSSSGGNTFIGSNTGRYTTGSYNTLIGNNTDTQSSIGSNFSMYNTYLGYNIGSGITSYSPYNTFIGSQTANGYVGNGINGTNTAIGANQNWSTISTGQGYVTLSDGQGSIKYMRFPSGNTNIGGTTDNGIQAFQVNGGIYASTVALTGTTWSSFSYNISSASTANYYYVYTGTGAGTITLPSASGNNNIYVFINATNMSHNISTTGGQFILQKNIGTSVTSITNSMYGTIMLIADGNNKYYQIVN